MLLVGCTGENYGEEMAFASWDYANDVRDETTVLGVEDDAIVETSPEATSEPTPEPTQDPTPEPTPQPTPESTPE